MIIDLDSVFITPQGSMAWMLEAARGVRAAVALGLEEEARRVEEQGEVLPSGKLRIFVEVKKHVLAELILPECEWQWRQ